MKYPSKNVLLVVGAAALVVLLLVLRPAWGVPALPLALLAVCPLSMMFMMRGMSGHGQEGQSPAAGTDLSRQVADLQEEVRILRAAAARPGVMPEAPASGGTGGELAG